MIVTIELGRKKTSLTLDESIWKDFQTYALQKHGNTRSANTELEKAMQEYMDTHPVQKEQRGRKGGRMGT